MNIFRFLMILAFGILLNANTALLAEDIEENRIVVIVAPDKPIEVAKAATLEIRELMVVATDGAGKRSVWQREFYKGSAPLFPDDSSALEEKKIQSALGEYLALVKVIPDNNELLQAEQKKWEDKLTELGAAKKQADEEKAKKLKKQIDELLTVSYDINEPYELSTIEQLLTLAASFSKEAPDRAGELSKFIKPWQEHAAGLKAGKVLYDGGWIDPQELKKLKEEKPQESIKKYIEEEMQLQMDAVVVPQMSVLLAGALVILTLVLVLYMFLHLASSRGGTLTFGGALFLLIGLAVLGAYGYFGYKVFSAPTSIENYIALGESATDAEDRRKLERALYVVSKKEGIELSQSDTKLKLSDIQLNKLIKNQMEYVREGESELFDLERIGFAIVFLPDRILFVDEVVVFGKSFLIRYELIHHVVDNLLTFDQVVVYFGGARLMGQFTSYFWINLRSDLKSLINASGMEDVYGISNVEEGELSLVMIRKPVVATESKSEEAGSE